MSPAYPTPAYPDALKALRELWRPGDVREIRLLKERGAEAGFFTDPQRACDAIFNADNASIVGAYVTVNPVNPELVARCDNRLKYAAQGMGAKDVDVVARRLLAFDVDPKRLTGVSSTDAEHIKAIEKAQYVAAVMEFRHGWPVPEIIDSGNGAHLRWRIETPNTPEIAMLFQACLARASAEFDDDAVKLDTTIFNASRILRIPGTIARKGDHMADRPHRTSRIILPYDGLSILPLAKVESFARPNGAPAPQEPRQTTKAPPGSPKWASLNHAALARLDDWVPNLFPFARRYGDGFRLTSADLGRDLEEDYSISPKGVFDFGEHDQAEERHGGKRTALMLVAEFVTNGDEDQAASLLASLLGTATTAMPPITQELKAPAGYGDPNADLGAVEDLPVAFRMDDADTETEFPPPPPAIWPGIAYAGFANFMFAAAKMGKTTLFYEMILRALMGLPLWGVPCTFVPDWALLFLFEESSELGLIKKLRAQYRGICKAEGMPFVEKEMYDLIHGKIKFKCFNTHLYQQRVKRGAELGLSDAGIYASIFPTIDECKTRLGPNGIVMVDTYLQLVGYYATNRDPVQTDKARVQMINDISFNRDGVTVFATGHRNKASNEMSLENAQSGIAGTHGVAAQVFNMLHMKGTPDHKNGKRQPVHLIIHSRFDDDIDKEDNEPATLKAFDLQPERLLMKPIAKPKFDAGIADMDQQQVYTIMRTRPDEFHTARSMHKYVKMSKDRVERAMSAVGDTGIIAREIDAKNGYLFYAIHGSKGHKLVRAKLGIVGPVGLPALL